MKIKKTKLVKKKIALPVFIAIILCIIGTVLSGAFVLNGKTSKIEVGIVTGKTKLSLRLSPSPISSSTPTLTPTPTSTPLVGFCLDVPVLMYHHIQPQAEAISQGQTALNVDNGEFNIQMEYLISNGYSVISAKQLVDALINHTHLGKSVVVTVDDGYKDAYLYAYPVLQRYHIVASFAIPTGLLEGADYMTWNQLGQIVHSGLGYVMDHTWSHYSISNGPPDKVKFEIATAKQQLQSHLGQTVDIFTYPYGAITPSAIAALQQQGMIAAFSEIPGFWQCDSFLMSLHRTRIGNAPLSYYGL